MFKMFAAPIAAGNNSRKVAKLMMAHSGCHKLGQNKNGIF